MTIGYILSRLTACVLAFLMGVLIYVFGLDLLRHGLNVDLRPAQAVLAVASRCGDGLVTYPKECDAGPDNGFNTSSSLRTYILWGHWYCSKKCTATDNFMFWEPKP